jgi:hypothetical protein
LPAFPILFVAPFLPKPGSDFAFPDPRKINPPQAGDQSRQKAVGVGSDKNDKSPSRRLFHYFKRRILRLRSHLVGGINYHRTESRHHRTAAKEILSLSYFAYADFGFSGTDDEPFPANGRIILKRRVKSSAKEKLADLAVAEKEKTADSRSFSLSG